MAEIGILHPGEMGAYIAENAKESGHTVYWLSTGRSSASRLRAERIGLSEMKDAAAFCQRSQIIFSVCPPHAAETTAQAVIEQAFTGVYVDANAISPGRSKRIETMCKAAGIDYVDGGIIGSPSRHKMETFLYLCGEKAESVVDCFEAGPVEARFLGKEIGKASALKMCFAANTKGTTALLTSILALAESLGVREALEDQWRIYDTPFVENTQSRARRVTRKAWRFAGEMEEIADTLKAENLPDGFFLSAQELYQRLAIFKDAEHLPDLETVLQALLKPEIKPDSP